MDEAKKKMTGTPVIFFSFCGSAVRVGSRLGLHGRKTAPQRLDSIRKRKNPLLQQRVLPGANSQYKHSPKRDQSFTCEQA